MQFLYVFSSIFLVIFGLASLIHFLVAALLDGGSRKYDVYVKEDEFIEEFVKDARKSCFIGKIYIIKNNGSAESRRLSDKYKEVQFISDGRQL